MEGKRGGEAGKERRGGGGGKNKTREAKEWKKGGRE